MNWDDLRYFLAVARTGRLTAAGERLGVDHTTVRRRISTLEEAIGQTLFTRTQRGYALTDVGARLQTTAEQVEAQIDSAADEMGQRGASLAGPVRIGAPEGVASYVLADAVADLCREHPHLEAQILAMPKNFSLTDREVDVAIAVSPPKSGRLRVRRVCDYSLHVYGTEAYLSRKPPIRELEDFLKVRGIGYVEDMIFDNELNYLPLIREDFRTRLNSTSLYVQLRMALGGHGVAILPDFMAMRHPELQQVLPQEVSITRTFWMILHEDLRRLEKVRKTADFLADRMRQAIPRPVAR